MYRGPGWIYTPSSSLYTLPAIDQQLNQFEILAGYVLSAQKVGDELLSTPSGLHVYEINVSDFSSPDPIKKMLRSLTLTFDESRLNEVVANGPVNQRSDEKLEKLEKQETPVPTDIAFYEQIVNEYQSKYT